MNIEAALSGKLHEKWILKKAKELISTSGLKGEYPLALHQMHRDYGATIDEVCGKCPWWKKHRHDPSVKRVNKEVREGKVGGCSFLPGTKWMSDWPACGKFEVWEQEAVTL